MKSNELRIGNSILMNGEVVHNIGYAVIMDVHQINKGVKNEYLNTVKYEPIPITQEWLLKFGFKKEHNTGTADEWYWKGRGISLTHELQLGSSDRYYESMPVDGATPLKYVHQLQNLYFALTGEELKIKEHETI